MSDDDWAAPYVRCLGVRLAGDAIEEMDEQGQRIIGDTLLLLMNAHHEPISFKLPADGRQERWERMLDTADPNADTAICSPRTAYPLQGRSLALFRLRPAAAS
jgi:glycogen operon protein